MALKCPAAINFPSFICGFWETKKWIFCRRNFIKNYLQIIFKNKADFLRYFTEKMKWNCISLWGEGNGMDNANQNINHQNFWVQLQNSKCNSFLSAAAAPTHTILQRNKQTWDSQARLPFSAQCTSQFWGGKLAMAGCCSSCSTSIGQACRIAFRPPPRARSQTAIKEDRDVWNEWVLFNRGPSPTSPCEWPFRL